MQRVASLRCAVARTRRAGAWLRRAVAAPAASRGARSRRAGPSRWAARPRAHRRGAARCACSSPTDPRDHWMRGAARHDRSIAVAGRVTTPRARIAAPQREALPRVARDGVPAADCSPLLPECDAIDRLADWATRDEDNGVPDAAARRSRAPARQRATRCSRYLDEAAGAAALRRLLERGALVVWECAARRCPARPIRPRAPSSRRRLRRRAAAARGQRRSQGMCRDARKPRPTTLRAACARGGRRAGASAARRGRRV